MKKWDDIAFEVEAGSIEFEFEPLPETSPYLYVTDEELRVNVTAWSEENGYEVVSVDFMELVKIWFDFESGDVRSEAEKSRAKFISVLEQAITVLKSHPYYTHEDWCRDINQK